TAGSNSSTCERQRSRNSRDVSLPAAKFAAAEKNGIGCGNVIASLHNPRRNLRNTFSYPQVGPHTGVVGRPQRRIVRARAIEADLAREGLDAVRNPDV